MSDATTAVTGLPCETDRRPAGRALRSAAPTARNDASAGGRRISELRRQLRVLQVQRATSGHGLIA